MSLANPVAREGRGWNKGKGKVGKIDMVNLDPEPSRGGMSWLYLVGHLGHLVVNL